jgi:two-component system, OmpR family, sensor histidine kinase CpxA
VIALATTILLISILLWLPFVRRLTGTIRQLTNATEQIAEERFDIRVTTSREDELGRLGRAVNHLAERLDGFVKGQKRFLGDISHELNSPLARMGIALEILEERADPSLHNYISDVREEVTLMSQLVSELLVYARSGLKGVRINLVTVELRPLIEKVVAREAGGVEVRIEMGEDLEVLAQPELLSRALANVVRNAKRYAGDAGGIVVRDARRDELVVISVIDQGAGIPENQLDRIFDPFYRLEDDRARETGGTGLGLAIVKTCIEACQGRVSAHNLTPGFEIRMEIARG